VQFSQILELLSQVKDHKTVIRNAMDEQSQGSSQILEAIREMNSIILQVKDGSSQMLTDSMEILGEMQRLSLQTEEMSNGMDQMSSGAQEINTRRPEREQTDPGNEGQRDRPRGGSLQVQGLSRSA